MNRLQLHACPVRGCAGERQRWEAVCGTCWALLPFDKRRAVLDARKARARHLEAAASIDAVAWLNAHRPAVQVAKILGEQGEG
jgi:hypothetical protein